MRNLFISVLLLGLCCVAAEQLQPAGHRRVSLDRDWRFAKGDISGAEQPGFSDGSWRTLDVPHDWAIEGPFDPKINAHEGSLPATGVAWYRKTFTQPANVAEKRVFVQFDGAMSNARVWLNGHEVGERPYGYISFGFDLTPYLAKSGEPNVLAVRLAPEPQSSRWYAGAGIYRNVWLDITDPVHVAHWGTYIRTPEAGAKQATLSIRTDVRNDSSDPASIALETTIVDAAGKVVGRAEAPLNIAPNASATTDQNIAVNTPHRWDVDDPYLYRAVSTVRRSGRVLDRYETPFGIRSIEFDKSRGFLLNGRVLKMHGVCLHHDLGALGSAVNGRAIERQLQIMKSMGANAVRTSHNPPAPELLEYADRLGMLVMDEAFDMWRIPKVKNGLSKFYDTWSETDLRDMIRRDRNHPSVIMWSIGNEIPEQHQAEGWKEARRLTDIVHNEDPTRPTTAAFNEWPNMIRNKLADNVDVPGFNYKPLNYTEVLRDHPNWVIVGAETASCVSSRGVYHFPLENYQSHESLQITSYDVVAPPWAYCPDPEFDAQRANPTVLGEFVWTGFDYIGEPTPFGQAKDPKRWARSSYFGIVDLAGFPKDRYYLYQSEWTNKPMVHVLPHWNWAGREGQDTPVMVYTNAESAELFLNGKSLGRKTKGVDTVVIPVGKNISKEGKYTTKYRLMWTVPYQPGALKAVAYTGGKQVAVDEVRTTGAPARVVLKPDRTRIASDGSDLSYVTVRIEDKDGNLCPVADNLVNFKLDGPGKIAGVDNGNAATIEPFQADHRMAFNGLALLIVRSERGRPGAIRVTAASDGLASGTASITAAALR